MLLFFIHGYLSYSIKQLKFSYKLKSFFLSGAVLDFDEKAAIFLEKRQYEMKKSKIIDSKLKLENKVQKRTPIWVRLLLQRKV